MIRKKRRNSKTDVSVMAVEEIQLQALDFGDVGLELKDLNLNYFDVNAKQKYSEETRYMKPKVYVKGFTHTITP